MEDSPPPLDYATPEKPDHSPVARSILISIGIIGVAFLVLSLVLPSFNRPYVNSNRDHCLSNLHQIGLGILLYCNDNNGQYPDSFQTILLNEQLTAAVFTCPSTYDTPSTAPTTQEQAADMAKAGHVSYIYLGKDLTDKTVLPNQVIAYEPLANHGDGIDVLLGDGHAEFVNVTRAKKIISDASAGKSPVMLPP
jgi:hypothetical protein